MSSHIPVVRQISWVAVMIQLVALLLLVHFARSIIHEDYRVYSFLIGAMIYLAYSQISRYLLTAAHRTGVNCFLRRDFKSALEFFQQSYDFFSKLPWIDDYRAVTMMSPSRVSYREMALLNIAFCYGQLGDARLAKRYYQQVLEEFPDSEMGKASMKMIETFQRAED